MQKKYDFDLPCDSRITKEEHERWNWKQTRNEKPYVVNTFLSGEGFKHYIIKSGITKILIDKKVKVVTEVYSADDSLRTEGCYDGRFIDVVDFDNDIFYEIETKPNNKKLREIKTKLKPLTDIGFKLIIINTNYISNEIDMMETQLKELVNNK